MKRISTAIILTLILSFARGQAPAQDTEYVSFYLKPSFGTTLSLSSLMIGEITDHLIEFQDNYNHTQLLSLSYFFNKRLGIELYYQWCDGNNIDSRDNHFNHELEDIYGTEYYLTTENNPIPMTNMVSNRFDRGFASLVFKLEKNKYCLIPKFHLGFTTIPLERSEVLLKTINTNEYLRLNFDTDAEKNFYLTVGPGVSVGRRFFNHILVTLDFQYNYFRPNFSYTIEIRELYTSTVTTKINDYKKNIHSVSLGIGFAFEMRYKNVKQ
jgi:hypothetical protein